MGAFPDGLFSARPGIDAVVDISGDRAHCHQFICGAHSTQGFGRPRNRLVSLLPRREPVIAERFR
jgi:hypothetical protein